MCLAHPLLCDSKNRFKIVVGAFRFFSEAPAARVTLICERQSLNVFPSVIMVASVIACLSASLDSPHRMQEINYSSFSPWHAEHSNSDRTVDNLARDAFRPVSGCIGGPIGANRELVPCDTLVVSGRKTRNIKVGVEL